MNMLLIIGFLMMSSNGKEEHITNVSSVQPPDDWQELYVQPLYSDENGSSFLIWIEASVPYHKHVEHTEHVLILEGSGTMTVSGKSTEVKAGDYIALPTGTPHGVVITSEEPMKVLSIQTPEFFGKDRVPVED